MSKLFSSFEDVAADEDFLAWYTNAPPDRGAAWQQWLAQNPQCGPLVDEAVRYLNALRLPEKEVPAEQTEAAHKRLMQALMKEVGPVIKMEPRKRKWWIPAAAAAILIIIAGALFWKSDTNGTVELNTAYGQVRQYHLPDGSDVMLNANSKLSMENWKEGADREVWMEGEAFFHVKKTAAKTPFVVHARQMDIIVTGTQFNVINREGENSVLLKEGSVTVKTAGGELIKMVPGDNVTIQDRLPQKEVNASPEKVLAWTQAKLVFENTPMREAQKLISRHYGVTVKLEKAIEEKTISGILPNDNLDILLKALEAAKGFQIQRRDGEIMISGSQQ